MDQPFWFLTLLFSLLDLVWSANELRTVAPGESVKMTWNITKPEAPNSVILVHDGAKYMEILRPEKYITFNMFDPKYDKLYRRNQESLGGDNLNLTCEIIAADAASAGVYTLSYTGPQVVEIARVTVLLLIPPEPTITVVDQKSDFISLSCNDTAAPDVPRDRRVLPRARWFSTQKLEDQDMTKSSLNLFLPSSTIVSCQLTLSDDIIVNSSKLDLSRYRALSERANPSMSSTREATDSKSPLDMISALILHAALLLVL